MNVSLVVNQSQAPQNLYVKEFVEELMKKNKRLSNYRKEAIKQAQFITPLYREFLTKIIANKSLKIVNEWKGYIEPINFKDHSVIKVKDGEIVFENKLSRKRSNKVHAHIGDDRVLPHELGHAVDFMFGFSNELTDLVLLSGGRTLHQIFSEEFETNEEYLYNLVMDEYKNIIDSNIYDGAFDILMNNMDEYKVLSEIPVNKVKSNKIARKALQKKLYECGFVDVYYLLTEKNCFQILNHKYSPILDALSAHHELKDLFLVHHDADYYQCSKKNITYEFFANMFEAKVTGQYQHIYHLSRLLPKSFNAFEELFNICFEHIVNNKKFTDVAIRERTTKDDR